jgi:type IV secretion system protein TrbJ
MSNISNEMILQAINELADQLKNHTKETNLRFEQIDRRFEQIDRRFEQIDHRFEQIDQQLVQINQRFEKVEEKIEQMDKQITDVANGQKILVEELFDNKKEMKRVKNVLNMF